MTEPATSGMTRWDASGRPPWHHAYEWSPQRVQPGDSLIATDALGVEHECFAATGYEGVHFGHRWKDDPAPAPPTNTTKIHDFPVIWVRFTTQGDMVPRPVESLRPAAEPATRPDGR